jgi:hypothetical protein
MGAADTDGRGFRLESDLLAVALAHQPGDRAQATLEHVHHDVVALRLAGDIVVIFDLELGARTHDDFAAVGKLDAGEGLRLRTQSVAFQNLRFDREQFAAAVRALCRKGS